VDPGLICDAHLFAHRLLVEALILWVPKTVCLGDVRVLADAAEMMTMLAGVVFV
jgi:hypothetical protein